MCVRSGVQPSGFVHDLGRWGIVLRALLFTPLMLQSINPQDVGVRDILVKMEDFFLRQTYKPNQKVSAFPHSV